MALTINESLLTVEEAARIMQVHPITVYRLAGEGKLASLKVGSGRAIPRTAAEQYQRPPGSPYTRRPRQVVAA